MWMNTLILSVKVDCHKDNLPACMHYMTSGPFNKGNTVVKKQQQIIIWGGFYAAPPPPPPPPPPYEALIVVLVLEPGVKTVFPY